MFENVLGAMPRVFEKYFNQNLPKFSPRNRTQLQAKKNHFYTYPKQDNRIDSNRKRVFDRRENVAV